MSGPVLFDVTPKRIQRRRVKGWQMPDGAVYVGRPSKWGNPFVRHSDGYPMEPGNALDCFRELLSKEGAWCPVPVAKWPKGKIPATFTTVEDVRRELRGKNLACWCPLDQACHADVLLEIANAKAGDGA